MGKRGALWRTRGTPGGVGETERGSRGKFIRGSNQEIERKRMESTREKLGGLVLGKNKRLIRQSPTDFFLLFWGKKRGDWGKNPNSN